MLDIIFIFKCVGILWASVSGIVTLFVKFKDEEGHITRAGHIWVVSIIASAFIAIIAQSIEWTKQQKETIAALERNEQLLLGINRAVHTIKDIRITYFITIPGDNIEFKNYIDRLHRELNNWPTYWIKNIGSKSSIAHRKGTEIAAFFILGQADINLQFYKDHIDVKEISDRDIEEKRKETDLQVGASSRLDTRGLSSNELIDEHELRYDIDKNQFEIYGQSILCSPRYWRSTGKIVSIPDLAGAQMFIIPTSLHDIVAPGDKIRRRLQLTSIEISINGRYFSFGQKDLIVHRSKDGFPFYEFKFPKEEKEFSKLSR